jgi:hypothetical protein
MATLAVAALKHKDQLAPSGRRQNTSDPSSRSPMDYFAQRVVVLLFQRNLPKLFVPRRVMGIGRVCGVIPFHFIAIIQYRFVNTRARNISINA